MFSIFPAGEEKMESIGSHLSLLDRYWSAGRAAAAAGRFTPAFYHDEMGVWPIQAKSLSAWRRLYHLQRQTWWPMRYADVSIIWNPPLFLLLLLRVVGEAPGSTGLWWDCRTCGQINMSALSTFYSSHMLWSDWTSGVLQPPQQKPNYP